MRIIPARAGFTTILMAAPYERTGSSPLARGLHALKTYRPVRKRIIPARAGFTKQVQAYAGNMRDHPRSRGVYGSWARGLCMM